jgi:hypothetical protein
MQVDSTSEKLRFELVSTSPNGGKIAFPLKVGRSLVGRGQACDIVIPFGDISSIHAVVELNQKGEIKVYDLNSKNGTRVDGNRVVVESIKVDTPFFFGDNTVTISPQSSSELMPPPLDMLSKLPPTMASRSTSSAEAVTPSLPKATPPVANIQDEVIPRVKYPLAKDPKAEFSEYIFEDTEDLYPIFKYEVGKSAVEVIIVFNDRIQSVDYLPEGNGTFSLTGSNPKSREIEYPYLGKDETVSFIKYLNGEVEVLALPGYSANVVGAKEGQTINNSIILINDEVVQFSNQHIQIFVRRTEKPPKVAPAPVLRRDSDFKKYLFLILFLMTSFLATFSFFEVDEEIEKEKAPERIATILYKRKLTVSKVRAIDKTKKAPKIVQKSPKLSKSKPKVTKPKPKVAKSKPKKKPVKKAGSRTAKKTGSVKKANPNKGPRNIKKNRVTPVKAKNAGGSQNVKRASKVAKSTSKSKGAVDTYRSADFKSTVSSLLSKGGSTRAAKAVSAASAGLTGSSLSKADPGATLTTAKVSNNIGNIGGDFKGKLDNSKGVEGLVSKKSIYTAGLPFKTVILGGLDPDVIRQILVDNIPRFRYCYQNALDKSKAVFNGIVRLNFIIGASGHVSKAGVDSISSLPRDVKGCVVKVLKRIRFPAPRGGGVVEVNQPMNFYPRAK